MKIKGPCCIPMRPAAFRTDAPGTVALIFAGLTVG
jgi:hypothetical protein